MSHIFISYSTKNAEYAYRLADKLRDEGFDVWIDNDELRASDNWWESIVRALRAASAFVVIMTPASRDSRWVQREVTLADNWSKPAFPLLLEGENFEIYVLTQFHTVKDGTLPKPKFYDDLARHTKREKRKGQVVTEESSAQAPNDAAVKAALVNEPLPEPAHTPIKPVGKASMPSVGSKTKSLLPPPFDWCEIPAGKVTLEPIEDFDYIPIEGQTFDVYDFYLGKYPITNAQYAKFMAANGYGNNHWWTEKGWQHKEVNRWTEPRFWRDVRFNTANQPVVGVSWYECIAFCLWLSDVSGEKIMLPTEQQWQRAAQGDDGRMYPWRGGFDKNNANTGESQIGKTTVVDAYPSAASPFGVLDMGGNVYEWCLTEFYSGSNALDETIAKHPEEKLVQRVLRGCSFEDNFVRASVTNRDFNEPDYRLDDFGFRICAIL